MSSGPGCQRRRIAILGGGGHGRVIAELLAADPDVELVGVVDPREVSMPGVPYLGSDEVLPCLLDRGIADIALAVGALGNLPTRERLGRTVGRHGLRLATVVAKQAYVSPSAELQEGCQILPMAVVSANAHIGKGTIVYSGAVIEHDSRVGPWCLVAPRAALAGGVTIGERVQIGIGAVVREGVRIAPDSVIGAGAVVVGDIDEAGCYYGVPARRRPAASAA